MDFITKRFERRIRLASPGSVDRRSLLQARIEYLYYFMLGYLWNKQREGLTREELTDFVGKLNGKLTIGSIVHTLKVFDKEKDFIDGRDAEKILQKYVGYRNDNIGHGYVFGDKAEESERVLEDLYQDLRKSIPSIQRPMDLVLVQGEKLTGGRRVYTGYVFKADENGEADSWSCPADLMDLKEGFPQVCCRTDGQYFVISPFVLVEGIDADCYVFNRIEQKLTGKSVFSKLFESNKVDRTVEEFINTSITNDYQIISSNGTVMNRFETNYRDAYIEVGLTDVVKRFALYNSSSVSAALWGNGGVGKTACAQKVCWDFFNDSACAFEYIVFVTAKNRRFNERTGQIEDFENNQSYFKVINTIYTTRYGCPLECAENSPEFEKAENKILQMRGQGKRRALLLVIDDYETFSDDEKGKISKFIQKLDISSHKVIITTRNLKLVGGGHSIKSSALDREHTIRFLREKIRQVYPDCWERFETLSGKPEFQERVYEATGGVPIFILQWLHLFVQNPSGEELYQRFDTRAAAREFLSGRVYDSLREDARLLYAVLSVVVSSDDQTFQIARLRYVCEKSLKSPDPDSFDDAFQELEDLCIVEQYQIDQDTRANSLYRVYTQSFLDDMETRFGALGEPVRDAIKGRLKNTGGNAAKHSVFDSLLIDARQSRGQNNETVTVSKYRHIIKHVECPYAQKRQALIELIGYFFSYQDNPDKAIETMRTYERSFERDPQVLYKYVYLLWGASDAAYKAVAFEELKKYFEGDLSVTAGNVQFFALGAAYYTIYVLNGTIKSDMESAKWAHRICKALFDYVSGATEQEDSDAVREFQHELKVALLKAVQLTANLAAYELSYAEECIRIGNYFLDAFPKSVLECNSVKKQLTTVKRLVGADGTPEQEGDLPEGCVAFFPQYVKYNIDGLPQYLNGMVDRTKGGVAWYDFDKFGQELHGRGGTEAVMQALIDRGASVPAVITSVSDRGMYSLSLYDTGFALCDLMQWGQETPRTVRDAGDLKTGVVAELICQEKFNKAANRYESVLTRGEVRGDDGVPYRIGRAELEKAPALREGCRVSFRETENHNPNAPKNVRYACDLTELR